MYDATTGVVTGRDDPSVVATEVRLGAPDAHTERPLGWPVRQSFLRAPSSSWLLTPPPHVRL